MKKIVFILAVLLAGLTLLPALVKEEDRMVSDPDMTEGWLDNGLHYYILPNGLPENRVELRMIVNAGSVLERDDQIGLAHLLEHMAFNGTRSFPKNELVEYLQSLGMEFGPETNAYTSFDDTVYQLSVPIGEAEEWKTGLQVLQEWAFHITLEPEQIDSERSVIIEEWRSGRSAVKRMHERALPDLYKDSAYGQRMPIGTVESIENFEHQSLIDFYNDWYRPELISLVVVGDINTAEVELWIKEHFSEYQNPENAPERRETPIPSQPEDIFTLHHDPETTYSSLEISIKKKGYHLNNGHDYRKYIAEQLYLMMFNNRIANLLREGEAPFIDGYLSVNNRMPARDKLSFGVVTGSDQMKEGFRVFWTEKERIDRFGFTDQEFSQAKRELKSSYDYLYGERESLYSDNLVEMVQYSALKGEPYPQLEWEWEVSTSILEEIEQNEVMNLMQKWQEPGDRVFFAMERTGEDLLTEEFLTDLMDEISRTELQPRPEEKVLGDLVPYLPAAGTLTYSGPLEGAQDLGIHLLEYSNGARVYLKSTDFRENEIQFKAISPGGASLVDDEDYISAVLSTNAVIQSGLGEFSLTDLERLLADKYISISPNIEDYSESIGGFCAPADFDTLMKMVYLYFVAPTYDENRWLAYESRLRPYLESQERDPTEQYRRRMTEILYDGHFRREPLTAEALDQMDYERAFRIFKQRFLTGGDFQFFLVGQLDIEEITPVITQWIGALPPEPAPETWVDQGIRFTVEDNRNTLEMGQDPLSVVTLVKTGAMEWTYEENLNIRALASALQDRLLEVIREKMGGSYSVVVSPQTRDIPSGEYAFYFQFSCDPQRVEELIEAIYFEIDQFQQGIDLENLARNVREAELSQWEENQQNNRWWLNQLTFHMSMERNSLDKIALFPELVEGITAQSLQESAKKYLNDDVALQEIILNPETP